MVVGCQISKKDLESTDASSTVVAKRKSPAKTPNTIKTPQFFTKLSIRTLESHLTPLVRRLGLTSCLSEELAIRSFDTRHM